MWGIILGVVASLGVGGILGWWLTERFGLQIAHKNRIIEEHAKKVHEYSEKYYIKNIAYIDFIESRLCEILVQLRKSEVPSKETVELSLFGWARLSKLEEEWFRDSSATLMLTDRTSEGLIVNLHQKVQELLINNIGCISIEDDSILREHIQNQEPLSEFKVKIQKQPLKQIADKYKSAIQSDTNLLGSLIDTLSCLRKLLYFEVNTCFDAWYRKKATRPALYDREWKLVSAELDRLVNNGKASADDKKAYLKKIGEANDKQSDPLAKKKFIKRTSKKPSSNDQPST